MISPILPAIALALLLTNSVFAQAAPSIDQAEGSKEPSQSQSEPQRDVLKIDLPAEYLVFTEPKRPDGTIDYITAINNKYSRGVTHQNNAYRDLFVLFDHVKEEIDPDHIRQTQQLLGLDAAALKQGPYLEALDDFLEKHNRDPYELRQAFAENPLVASQDPLFQQWLIVNKPVLRRAMKAIEKPCYWAPFTKTTKDESVVNVILPSLGQNRVITRSLQYWAFHEIKSGNAGRAIEIIGSLRHLAHHQSQDPSLISVLVGISINVVALDLVETLIESQILSTGNIQRLHLILSRHPAQFRMQTVIVEGEACMGLDLYMHILANRVSVVDFLQGGRFEFEYFR